MPIGDSLKRHGKPVHQPLLLAALALLAFDLAVGAHGVELLDDDRRGVALADGLSDACGRVFAGSKAIGDQGAQRGVVAGVHDAAS